MTEQRQFTSAKQELLCQWCGYDYPVWYAPNELWNQVIQESDKLHFLCPTCFMVLASERGVNPISWKVEIGAQPVETAWQHIVPLNDLITHDTVTKNCQCVPKIDEKNCLVIHSAMDNRELSEIAEKIERESD